MENHQQEHNPKLREGAMVIIAQVEDDSPEEAFAGKRGIVKGVLEKSGGLLCTVKVGDEHHDFWSTQLKVWEGRTNEA